MKVQQGGCVWLAFNADAYSSYTVDNSGEVRVFVERDSRYRPPSPDLGPACKFLPGPWFKVVCWVANEVVGGGGAR